MGGRAERGGVRADFVAVITETHVAHGQVGGLAGGEGRGWLRKGCLERRLVIRHVAVGGIFVRGGLPVPDVVGIAVVRETRDGRVRRRIGRQRREPGVDHLTAGQDGDEIRAGLQPQRETVFVSAS